MSPHKLKFQSKSDQLDLDSAYTSIHGNIKAVTG